MMKWEYLVVNLPLDRQDKLNDYGSRGWELVVIIFEPDNEFNPTAYLKRPIKVDDDKSELIRASYKDWLNSQ